MRLFKYTAIIDWSGAANPIYKNGMVQVHDNFYEIREIKKRIRKQVLKDYKGAKIINLEQIPIIK